MPNQLADSLDFLDQFVDTSGFMEAWSEPQRVYHSLCHIKQVITDINSAIDHFSLDEDDQVLLYLGGWYHDIVYVPGAKDNELQSAQRVNAELGFGFDAMTVYNMVMKTKDHLRPKTLLEAILIDVDLAGMGTDAYYANSFKVKAEYAGITDEQWINGRFAFLEAFLARPTIYYSSWGAQFEQPCRINMNLEYQALKKRMV